MKESVLSTFSDDELKAEIEKRKENGQFIGKYYYTVGAQYDQDHDIECYVVNAYYTTNKNGKLSKGTIVSSFSKNHFYFPHSLKKDVIIELME